MKQLSVILLLPLNHCAWALAAWTANDIQSLQERLKENKFYSGPITGVLGRTTEQAIAKATAGFPEVAQATGEQREYFVTQIPSWYNNAHELEAAKSNKSGRSRHLQLKDTQLPDGRFRYATREDGAISIDR